MGADNIPRPFCYYVVYQHVSSVGFGAGVGWTEVNMQRPITTIDDILVARNQIAEDLGLPSDNVVVYTWVLMAQPGGEFWQHLGQTRKGSA